MELITTSERSPSQVAVDSLSPLLRRTAAGDTEAFAELVRSTSPWMLRMAWQLIRNHAQTEEALQEAYLEIWCTAHRFDDGRGNAQGWISMLVRHRAIDKIRSSESDARRAEKYSSSNQHIEHDSTAEEVHARLTGESLRRAVELLRPAEQQVIELAFWSGLSHSEVARILGLPLGTVKTRLRRAMSRLRSKLVDLEPQPEF